MSIFMLLRLDGDPDRFERHINENADLVHRIAAAAKAAGATRHAFAGGDGEILVIDEWPDQESFQRFFEAQSEIPQLLQDAGAEGPPRISIHRKLDTPDAF